MRRLVSDTLVIAERNLVRLPRAPDLLIAFTVQPVMFVLLFVYVFGGAISTPGYEYVDFLIPGIIVQNIAFGGFVTALGLNEDLHKGLIDRFRSLPMARPAVLAGRTLSDVVTNFLSIIVLLATGLIIGFSFDASPLEHEPISTMPAEISGGKWNTFVSVKPTIGMIENCATRPTITPFGIRTTPAKSCSVMCVPMPNMTS